MITDLMDMLHLDDTNTDLEKQEILLLLKQAGLSDYEAKAYVALVMRSHGSAENISDIAEIPRTSTYKVLNGLKEKGFVTTKTGRPTIYYPVKPSDIRDRLITEINKEFEMLTSLSGTLSEEGTPQLVYTIIGKEKVLAKIGDMISSADIELYISSPVLREINDGLPGKFKDALKRGVKVTVVAEPSTKVPEASIVIRKSDLLATDVIADSSSVMMAAPDLSICGFSDNPFLAIHLETFLKMSIVSEEQKRS